MKKTIFTALSPNAEIDDIFKALKVLFSPCKWQKGKELVLLEDKISEWLPAKHIFLFESGRTCLYAILKALDLKQNDEVLIQAYTCVAVPDPILWAGAKPVYVDCREEDFTMSVEDLEKKITSRSKVLIIQHTFGHAADLHALKKIAEKHNLFVIEDCAHSLGTKYENKNVGTFGDASFFSFGRDKVISSVFGGAIATNNKKIAEKIKEFHNECSPAPKKWILQQIVHPILMGIVKATYDFYLGKGLLKIFKGIGITSKAVYKIEREGGKPPFIFKKMPNSLAILALHQFGKLEKFNHHRREIAKIYGLGLINTAVTLPKSDGNSVPIFMRYTIKTQAHESTCSNNLNAKKTANICYPNMELIKAAKKEKIILGDWYTTSIAPDHVNYKKIGYNPVDCPIAEKIAKESVNLPTDIHISKNDALRIIYFLKKFHES